MSARCRARGRSVGVAPGAHEHLLHDLLGRAALAERVEREAEQLAGVGAVQRAQRLAGGVGLKAFHQLGVASARSCAYARCSTSSRADAAVVGAATVALARRRTASAWWRRRRGRRRGSARDALGDRAPSGGRRRSARRRARAARRAPTGAGPPAGPGRRTARRASARTRPARPPPRRRAPPAGARVAGADREVAEADADRRVAQPQLERRAVRALEVGVDDDQRRAVRARGRGRRGRAAGSGADRRSLGQRASSPSKMRLAPGRSPGSRGLVAPAHDAVGPDRSRARAAGSRRGCRRRRRGTPRPWARSPTAARSRCRAAPERLLRPRRVARDAVERGAAGGELVQHLVVDGQLVRADRREGEGVEDQDGGPALEVGVGERRRRRERASENSGRGLPAAMTAIAPCASGAGRARGSGRGSPRGPSSGSS